MLRPIALRLLAFTIIFQSTGCLFSKSHNEQKINYLKVKFKTLKLSNFLLVFCLKNPTSIRKWLSHKHVSVPQNSLFKTFCTFLIMAHHVSSNFAEQSGTNHCKRVIGERIRLLKQKKSCLKMQIRLLHSFGCSFCKLTFAAEIQFDDKKKSWSDVKSQRINFSLVLG